MELFLLGHIHISGKTRLNFQEPRFKIFLKIRQYFRNYFPDQFKILHKWI